MEWNLFIIGAVLLLGLYVMMALLYQPIRLLVRLLACLVTGVVLLVPANFILGYVDMHLAINPFTVLVAGILQLPGLVMLIVLSLLFV